MRIDLNPRPPEALDPSPAAKSDSRANKTAADARTSLDDQAQLSFDQVRLNQLLAEANGVPELRSHRVESLRRLITAGSYSVTPEQTASAIMSEMLGQQP